MNKYCTIILLVEITKDRVHFAVSTFNHVNAALIVPDYVQVSAACWNVSWYVGTCPAETLKLSQRISAKRARQLDGPTKT